MSIVSPPSIKESHKIEKKPRQVPEDNLVSVTRNLFSEEPKVAVKKRKRRSDKAYKGRNYKKVPSVDPYAGVSFKSLPTIDFTQKKYKMFIFDAGIPKVKLGRKFCNINRLTIDELLDLCGKWCQPDETATENISKSSLIVKLLIALMQKNEIFLLM